MPKKDKYYRTNWFSSAINVEKIWGSEHWKMKQFYLVCKAKSMAEANRIAVALGLGDKVFRSDFTAETSNPLEIELADKFGFIIYPLRSCDIREDFRDVKEIMNISERGGD